MLGKQQVIARSAFRLVERVGEKIRRFDEGSGLDSHRWIGLDEPYASSNTDRLTSFVCPARRTLRFVEHRQTHFVRLSSSTNLTLRRTPTDSLRSSVQLDEPYASSNTDRLTSFVCPARRTLRFVEHRQTHFVRLSSSTNLTLRRTPTDSLRSSVQLDEPYASSNTDRLTSFVCPARRTLRFVEHRQTHFVRLSSSTNLTLRRIGSRLRPCSPRRRRGRGSGPDRVLRGSPCSRPR